MIVTNTDVHVHIGCTLGDALGPIRADANGRFEATGDGLTKHVPDARIAERLGAIQSARQVCEDLLQDALDAGGTDNITITVGRAVAKELAG